MRSRLQRIITVFALSLLLLVSACTSEPPSRFEQAQQESSQRGASAVVKESEAGASFNKFFPPPSNGYQRVYTQEKKGFAQAKLKKDGKDVAVLAISDTINNPSAIEKFKTTSDTIAGYPAVQDGTQGTAILVNGRFQVKVMSRDSSFTESDRQLWLEKFDLNGLAQLK